jgi:hypothetical protein
VNPCLDLDREEWKRVHIGILNLPSDYEVSNLGWVRSTRREGAKGGILKPYRCPTRNGVYLKVDLRQNGRRYQRREGIEYGFC